MEGKVETCSTSKFRTGSCKHFNMRIFTSTTCDLLAIHVYITSRLHPVSLVPRPSITANVVEGLVKLLRRMMSDGRLEVWLIVLCMH